MSYLTLFGHSTFPENRTNNCCLMRMKWDHMCKPPAQLLAQSILRRLIPVLPLTFFLSWSKSQCWKENVWVGKGSLSGFSEGNTAVGACGLCIANPPPYAGQQARRFCKQPLDQFIDHKTVRQWDHQGASLCPLGQRSALDALRNGSNFLLTGGFY